MSPADNTTHNMQALSPYDDYDGKDPATWDWGTPDRAHQLEALSRKRTPTGRVVARDQAGDSSAGIVMFLAGLVVGAILSTIYFGYTSNHQSIGGGIKQLTRQIDGTNATATAVALEVDGQTSVVPDTPAVRAPDDYSFYENLPKAQEPSVIDTGDELVNLPGLVELPIDSQEQPVLDSTAMSDTPSSTALPTDDSLDQVLSADQPSASTQILRSTEELVAALEQELRDSTDGLSPPSNETSPIGAGNGNQQSIEQPAAQFTSGERELTVLKEATRDVVADEALATQSTLPVATSSTEPTSGMTNKGEFYMLQLAAYNSYEGADALRAKLALRGVESLIQKVGDGTGQFRVRMGPFIDYSKLSRAEQRIRNLGIDPERKLERHSG